MLSKIRIRNFQSIQECDIPVGGLTVIVGPSDVGKSAIVRAITAVAENRRSGDCIRRGARQAQVALIFDDVSVLWQRDKSVHYVVSRSGERSTYDKVGASVPSEVEEALRMGGVSTKDSVSVRLNLASQFDPPFLISESSPTKAKLLSTITGAGFLLEMAAVIVRRQRDISRGLEILTTEFNRQEALVKQYSVVDEVKAELIEAVDSFTHLQKLREAALRLYQADKSVQIAQSNLAFAERSIVPAELLESIDEQLVLLVVLFAFIDDIEDIRTRVSYAALIASRPVVDAGNLEPDFRGLDNIIAIINAIENGNVATAKLVDRAHNQEVDLQLAVENEEAMRRELGICPLCGAVM